jgi:hypothetical protein
LKELIKVKNTLKQVQIEAVQMTRKLLDGVYSDAEIKIAREVSGDQTEAPIMDQKAVWEEVLKKILKTLRSVSRGSTAPAPPSGPQIIRSLPDSA